jgi:tRNA(Ile)-lysidine synthase TilS/MesJ
MRRGALHNTALKLGCNKVALGHHRDDAIETLLLSTFYEGRIHTFSPVTYLDRKQLHLIRPFIYTEEKEIRAFVKEYGLKTVPSPCHMDGHTKRQYIKDLLRQLMKDNKEVKSNVFGALKRSGVDGWQETKKTAGICQTGYLTNQISIRPGICQTGNNLTPGSSKKYI